MYICVQFRFAFQRIFIIIIVINPHARERNINIIIVILFLSIKKKKGKNLTYDERTTTIDQRNAQILYTISSISGLTSTHAYII